MQRKNAIIIFLLGLFFTGVFFWFLPAKDKTLLNGASLIGSFFSIYGIAIGYIQILSLKELSRQTQVTVNDALIRLKNIIAISELSKSKKLVDEIQYYLHNANLNGALIRIKDLKETLIQTKYNDDLSKLTASKAFKTIILNTGIDMESLNDSILNKVDNVDKLLIIKHLESAKSTIIEFENELKFNNNA
ncbi:hypothetical protein KHS38_04100 [Mucilaginibacter sp. Bleaf8]|uniref:hypothetical protein n=1 Tax=Mucilaginibacter sp. Bleaf8 TaxID=2834430 RepID=UPI001BCD75B6|nr:hypothetical protein [Mucilaginibacter sp. Bleaf8]MBS7563580.1 hypothetical protein [Mucilaginibacter sp. Bleaf8]